MGRKLRPPRIGGFALLAEETAAEARRAVEKLQERRFGDSPIEHLFFAALVTEAGHGHRCCTDVRTIGPHYPVQSAQYGTRLMGLPQSTIYVEKQVQIAGWRMDFVLHYPAVRFAYDQNGDPTLDRVIVECDGHAFHERTKEQAARDRARDRLAQFEGLPILRFTGSEIWNDPLGCADEVLAFMERAP